jgi:hypothetical protein
VKISVQAKEKTRRAAKNISQYAYERWSRTDEEAARSEKTAQKRNEHYEFMLKRQSDLRLFRKFEISCKLPSSCKLPLVGHRRKSGETDQHARMACAAENRNRA